MPPQQIPSPFFDRQVQGFAPLVSGTPFRRQTGFEGAPLIGGGGMTGLLAQTFLEPHLRQMMGQYGMSPFGLHDQNVYDLLRRQQFTQSHQRALTEAAGAERSNLMRTFRGMAALTGTPWGGRQMEAAGGLADIGVAIAPFMAQVAPELLEQLGGLRGSPTVMANQMMLGGRYRVDPVTGRMGYSATTAATQARVLFRDLYERDDITDMRGLTAGRAGEMFNELQRRGMVFGPQTRPLENEQDPGGVSWGARRGRTMAALEDIERGPAGGKRLGEIAGRAGVANLAGGRGLQGLTAEDLDKLTLDPTVANRLRQFDAEGIKRSLQTYAGAISAIRDIFGDMGRPNAPMAELIQGLEAMTQGAGLSQIEPGRLGLMVRTTYNIAQNAGISMDAAMALQQHGANRAAQLGMEPIFGVRAAQGAMAFGQAYRAGGRAAVPAWGLMNADQLTQLDTNLRVQGAGSRLANRAAVATRLSEAVGGFAADSKAEAYMQALQTGQTQWIDPDSGNARSIDISPGEFNQMFVGGVGGTANAAGRGTGITSTSIQRMMGQREQNREVIEREGYGEMVRRVQPRQAQAWVASRFRETLAARLREQGIEPANIREATARISERMFEMDTETFRNTRQREAALGAIIGEELGDITTGQLKDRDIDPALFYRLAAGDIYGQANRSIPRSLLSGYRNLQNIHALQNQDTLREGENNRAQGIFDAQMQDAMTPLGRGSPLSKAMTYIQNLKTGLTDERRKESVGRLLAKTFGGVDQKAIQNQIAVPLLEMHRQREKVRELERDVLDAPEGPGRTKLIRDLRAAQQQLKDQVAGVTETAEDMGLRLDPEAITREEAEAALETERTLTERQRAARSIAVFGGREVTDVQAREALQPAGATEDQAREAFARRLSDKLVGEITDEKVTAEAEKTGETEEQVRTRFAEHVRTTAKTESEDLTGDALENERSKYLSEEQARTVVIDRRRRQAEADVTEARVTAAVAANPSLTRSAVRERLIELGRQDAEQREVTEKEWQAVQRGETEEQYEKRIGRPRREGETIEEYRAIGGFAPAPGLTAAERTGKMGLKLGRELIRRERQGVGLEPTDDELEAQRKTAERIVKERQAIEDARPEGQKKREVPTVERVMQESAQAQQIMDRFGITQDDLAVAKEKWNERSTTEPRLSWLLDETLAIKTMKRGQLTKDEQADEYSRYGAYWLSNEGAAFRESVQRADRSATGLSIAALGTTDVGPTMQLGLGGIKSATDIREAQSELAGLAFVYADSDPAKLLAGNLNIDRTTKRGRAAYERVMRQVSAARYKRHRAVGFIAEGTKGGEAARERLWGDPKDMAGELIVQGRGETEENYRKRVASLAEGLGKLRGLTPSQVRDAQLAMDKQNDLIDMAAGLSGDGVVVSARDLEDYSGAHGDASLNDLKTEKPKVFARLEEAQANRRLNASERDKNAPQLVGTRQLKWRVTQQLGRLARLRDDETEEAYVERVGVKRKEDEAFDDYEARVIKDKGQHFARRRGVIKGGSEWINTMAAMRILRERQDKARERFVISPEKLAGRLADTFVDTGEQVTLKDKRDLAGRIPSRGARDVARDFLTQGERLSKIAEERVKRLQEVDTDEHTEEQQEFLSARRQKQSRMIAADYLEAERADADKKGRGTAVKEFFTKYGIKEDQEGEVQQAARMFQRLGVVKAGKPGEEFGVDKLREAFNRVGAGRPLRGGAGGPGADGAPGVPVTQHIKGTLHITGLNRAGIDATLGHRADRYAGMS